jgi:hypothetical protein
MEKNMLCFYYEKSVTFNNPVMFNRNTSGDMEMVDAFAVTTSGDRVSADASADGAGDAVVADGDAVVADGVGDAYGNSTLLEPTSEICEPYDDSLADDVGAGVTCVPVMYASKQ